jgi:hypothetical protein
VLEEHYGVDGPPANVLALAGLAQEALGRPEDAIDCYRRALAKGNPPEGIAERLAALSSPSEVPADASPIVR